MAAAPKTNLGKMPCPEKGCDDHVAVMQAANGNLSYKCQNADCESTGYALAHTGAARRWLANLVKPKSALGNLPKAPAQKPVEKPVAPIPPTPEKPPKAPAAGGFDLTKL
jgi:hypothetical protein